MSAAKLKRAVKKFGESHLVPRGYRQVSPYAFEKPLAGLAQGMAFVNGAGAYKGSFTADVYWRYTCSPLASADAMDFCQRIGELSSGTDEWYPISDASSFDKILRVFERAVESLFFKYSEIAAIIRAYENREINPEVFFGPDPGWRAFNIGYCYKFLGDAVKARAYLMQVVDNFSSPGYDWVIERKETALKTLRNLDEECTEAALARGGPGSR